MSSPKSRTFRAAWLPIAGAILLGAAASCGEESSTAACPASVTYDNRTLSVDDAGVIRLVEDDGDGGVRLVPVADIETRLADSADAGCLTYPVPHDYD